MAKKTVSQRGQRITTYPPLLIPGGAMAVVTANDYAWAGGVGGVVRTTIHDPSTWQACISGLAMPQVMTLAYDGGWLFAGGFNGIARSADNGDNWVMAVMEIDRPLVAHIALAPDFAASGVGLAILENMLMRTEDGGATWHPSEEGLGDLQVGSVAWLDAETVFVGTVVGILRSENAGKTWQMVRDTNGEAVTALCRAGKTRLLAGMEKGAVLHSVDGGATWSALIDPLAIPSDGQWGYELDGDDEPESEEMGLEVLTDMIARFLDTPSVTYLITAGQAIFAATMVGLYTSYDDGATWQKILEVNVLSLYSDGRTIFVGVPSGVVLGNVGEGGWIEMNLPIHDARRLNVMDGAPVVAGWYSGLWRFASTKKEWQEAEKIVPPLFALQRQGERGWYASSMTGLYRSVDGGRNWRLVLPHIASFFAPDQPPPVIAPLAFGKDGFGLAFSRSEFLLQRTSDNGDTWSDMPSPFGALFVVALAVTPVGALAVTYDEQSHGLQLWRSTDKGDSWQRSAEISMHWPTVALWAEPSLAGLGNTIFVFQPDGTWITVNLPDEQKVQRIDGTHERLLARTTDGLLFSHDGGYTWGPFAAEGLDLDPRRVVDAALDGTSLWLLYTSGQVVRYTL
ncbi:MAG: hypothetical protein IT323_21830 [Anaerolineae bacterium]|nr:hypothetical protein [Anaerolineae bacterium]